MSQRYILGFPVSTEQLNITNAKVDFNGTPTDLVDVIATLEESSDITAVTAAYTAADVVVAAGAASALSTAVPLTTRGDLLRRGAAANERVALGTSGYHIQSDGTDAAWAGFVQAGSGVTTRTWQDKGRDFVDLKDFGATGDGSTNDTAAIQAAITAVSSTNRTLHVSPGTYMITPATVFADEDTGYTTYAAFILVSNLRIVADPGAVFKIANNVSTDGTPKSMAMFATNGVLSGIQIYGLDMDMNGANNLISPSRGSDTYNLWNQSQFLVSGTPAGVAARIDDVVIEGCTFRNNPGVCCLCMGQSNTASTTLGKRWRVVGNRFIENGLDTSDHTAVYGWADDVIFENNEIINSTAYGTVGRVGGVTGYEIHGTNHRIKGNHVKNYYRGMWVSSNLTAECNNSVISGNIFEVSFYGIDFFGNTSSLTDMKRTIIEGNVVVLDNTLVAAIPGATFKSAINIACEYGVSDVIIRNNWCVKTSASVDSAFITITSGSVASETHTRITVDGNSSLGTTFGAFIRTSATNGLGEITLRGNTWYNLSDGTSYTSPAGVIVLKTTTGNAITGLYLMNNACIDDRGSPQCDYGVWLIDPTITMLYCKANTSRGMVTAEYLEDTPTITTRKGDYHNLAYTTTWKASSAITLGNGTSTARFTQKDDQITVNVRLDVGSTTSFGAGALSFTVPFAAANDSLQKIGAARIFDSSAGQFTILASELEATATDATFQFTGGTNATSASPVALATSDIVSAQITYTKA